MIYTKISGRDYKSNNVATPKVTYDINTGPLAAVVGQPSFTIG